MLFMVIETFRDVPAMQARFQSQGRLLPADVEYRTSWMEANGGRCFQIMEAPDVAALQRWIDRWSDIVDFEVATVQTSQDYWAARARR